MTPVKIGSLLKTASKILAWNGGRLKFLIIFLFSFIHLIISFKKCQRKKIKLQNLLKTKIKVKNSKWIAENCEIKVEGNNNVAVDISQDKNVDTELNEEAIQTELDTSDIITSSDISVWNTSVSHGHSFALEAMTQTKFKGNTSVSHCRSSLLNAMTQTEFEVNTSVSHCYSSVLDAMAQTKPEVNKLVSYCCSSVLDAMTQTNLEVNNLSTSGSKCTSRPTLVTTLEKLKKLSHKLNKKIQTLGEEMHLREAQQSSFLQKLKQAEGRVSTSKVELQVAKELIQMKEKEVIKVQMESANFASKLSKKKTTMMSNIDETEQKLANVQERLKSCESQYSDMYKNQLVLDLQKKTSILESSMQVLNRKYETEYEACATIREQVEELKPVFEQVRKCEDYKSKYKGLKRHNAEIESSKNNLQKNLKEADSTNYQHVTEYLRIKRELSYCISAAKAFYLLCSDYHVHALKKTRQTILNRLQISAISKSTRFSLSPGKNSYSSWIVIKDMRDITMEWFKTLITLDIDNESDCIKTM